MAVGRREQFVESEGEAASLQRLMPPLGRGHLSSVPLPPLGPPVLKPNLGNKILVQSRGGEGVKRRNQILYSSHCSVTIALQRFQNNEWNFPFLYASHGPIHIFLFSLFVTFYGNL